MCLGALQDQPSLTDPAITVHDETIAFNTPATAHSQARLVDCNRAIVDFTTMAFSRSDRVELRKLTETDEDKIGDSRITDL